MPTRTFTLREAEELLPVLEGLLRSAVAAKKRSEEIDAHFQEVNTRVLLRGGMLLDIVPLAHLRAEREKLAQKIKDVSAEITALGVQVKDLDTGLLDFPCRVDGKTILLCWKLGEKRISHWHGTNEGFPGRKLIDARIANAGRGKSAQ